MTLDIFLDPNSVAVIGASDSEDKIGGRPIAFMKRFGFKGKIYPVNPSRTVIQGLPAFAGLDALPETPDVAIIAVAGQAAVDAVGQCAAAGVKGAIIIASGFSELGADGRLVEEKMRRTANDAGMRLVGPNSQGLANFATGAILSFSTMFIEAEPADGPVACLSQSGAMSVVPYGLLRARGIGVRHVHATGNDCDVSVSELAATVAADPDVKLILIYLEKLVDPEHLAKAAAVARGRGVPIIALKSGVSEEGKRAAASHTGAIASEDRVVDAFFRKHGIWRARNTTELVRAAELHLKGWRGGGRRLAIISNSGATCVLSADAAEREGLKVARLSSENEERIGKILPAFASSRNPIDITAALLSNGGLFGEVLPVVGSDPNIDMLLIGIPVSGRGYDFPRYARDTAKFMKEASFPVVVAAPQQSVRAAFAAEGVPVFETEDQAIAALAQFAMHREMIEHTRGHVLEQTDVVSTCGSAGDGKALDELRSLRIVADAGLDCARHLVCASVEDAVAVQREWARPVVVKAVSEEVPHKSDHGLVHLNVGGQDQVRSAYVDIADKMAALGKRFDGVLVSEMLKGDRELVIGANRDPHFGPVVVIGDGGIAVEAIPDNVLLLAPFSKQEFSGALARLRIAPLFEGVRGRSGLAIDTLFEAATNLADLLRDEADICSVEVNPILVSADAAIAVDALVVRGTAGK